MVEQRSHIGLWKKRNEDRLLVQKADLGWLLAVADGLGGQLGGAEAASLAITYLTQFQDVVVDDCNDLKALMFDINNLILAKGDDDSSLYGLASTLTVASVVQNKLHWAHIGDTRLYLCRDNILSQITRDDNLAQSHYEDGAITADERRSHKFAGFLEQVLGEDEIEPSCGSLDLQEGDLILLSSDGLHDMVADSEILKVLQGEDGLAELVQNLVIKALRAGGKDNVSIILLRQP